MSIAATWGTTEAERARPFPCDDLLPDADEALFRAVTVAAPAPLVFRWLCQLRIAPYSYDWLDNGGRRSPRRLTRGAGDLALGQRVMYIFRLASFERDRQLTLTLLDPFWGTLFGWATLSYTVVPQGAERARIVVKLLVRHTFWGRWRVMRRLFAWGDLLMMRKQLLTLQGHAERLARQALHTSPRATVPRPHASGSAEGPYAVAGPQVGTVRPVARSPRSA